MFTAASAQVLLRIMAAMLELAVVTVEKADPSQVQAILERHERRMAFIEKLLAKVITD